MARHEQTRRLPIEEHYPSTPEELGVGGKGSTPSPAEIESTRRELLSADPTTAWKLKRIFDATPGDSLIPRPKHRNNPESRRQLKGAAESGYVPAIMRYASSDAVGLRLARSLGPLKEAEYKRAKAQRELGSLANGEFPSTPEEAGLGSRGEKLIWSNGGSQHKENAGMIGFAGEPHYIMHFLKTVQGWPTGEDKKKD